MGRRFADGGLLRYRKWVPQQLGDVAADQWERGTATWPPITTLLNFFVWSTRPLLNFFGQLDGKLFLSFLPIIPWVLQTINHGLIWDELLVVALVLSISVELDCTQAPASAWPQYGLCLEMVEDTWENSPLQYHGLSWIHFLPRALLCTNRGKSHREDSSAPFSSVTLLSNTCSKVWVGALSRGNTCRLVLVPNVGQRENNEMCDHVGGSPDRTDNNTKYDSQQGRYHTSVHLLFQIQYNSIPPPPLHHTTYLEMYSFVHFTPSSFCQDTEPPAGWCWITSRPRNVLRWWWQGYRVFI